MDHPASLCAVLMTQSEQTARAKPAIALWIFAAALMAVAVAVLAADAALTPEQRIAAFVQSGTYP